MTTHAAQSAVEHAMAVFEREPCGITFASMLEAHLLHGFVFSRPDFFVMLRPVVSSAPRADIIDSWHCFHGEPCDCWHIALASGNLAKAWDFLPCELPLMSFERRNRLRFHDLRTLRSSITKG